MYPVEDSHLRASDAEREAAVEELRRHHLDGRLDTDEFQARVERCYAAKTIGQLEEELSDLPRDRSLVRGRRRRPAWRLAALVPLLAIVVLLAVVTGGHVLWLVFPAFFAFRGRCGRGCGLPRGRWRSRRTHYL